MFQVQSPKLKHCKKVMNIPTNSVGGEREPNQILLQESAYVSSSIPKAKTLQEGEE
jgi:hypothetical protein